MIPHHRAPGQVCIDLLRRRLERTTGSLFQPVVVEDEARIGAIFSALEAPGVLIGVAEGASFILKIGEAVQAGRFKGPYKIGLVLVRALGPLSAKDLNACNFGRSCIAGAGVPVVWLMSHVQMRQLQGCPDLWSCRGTEIFDIAT